MLLLLLRLVVFALVAVAVFLLAGFPLTLLALAAVLAAFLAGLLALASVRFLALRVAALRLVSLLVAARLALVLSLAGALVLPLALAALAGAFAVLALAAVLAAGAAVLALLGALCGLPGCVRGKGEAASLVAAVDRYRKADLRAKGPLADAIDAVPCSQEDVCAAKLACMAVARPTVKGAALKAEVAWLKRELSSSPKVVDADALRKAEEAAYRRGYDEGVATMLTVNEPMLEQAMAAIADLAIAEEAERIVVGLPTTLSGG